MDERRPTILSRSKRFLHRQFSRLKRVARRPCDHKTSLSLQDQLIEKITFVEKQIRSQRRIIATLRQSLASPNLGAHAREESRSLKQRISWAESRINEYQLLRCICLDIGDGLAFTFLDKFDITPMAFKCAPGFISCKKGSRLERQYLKKCFQEGKMAILNDLTNCLRYGDVTIFEDSKVIFAEVKTGERLGKRGTRQLKNLDELVNYLRDDTTIAEFDGQTVPMKRVALAAPEAHHREALNRLIAHSVKAGSSYIEAEEGLYYIVERSNHFLLPEVTAKVKGQSLVANINAFKHNNVAFYPFTLSLQDPKSLYDFYTGEFVLIVVVDSARLCGLLEPHNLSIELLHDEDWACSITKNIHPDASADEIMGVKVGVHFWTRLPVEFMSLEWFVAELIAKFHESAVCEAEM
ncbi:MAG TPA: hypothetical protein VK598_05895 [Nitrospiraceae bacterium]|nr:hypothetical protein [Nitrospiraceae bacterium]